MNSKIKLKCDWCGKIFYRWKSQLKHSKHYFCCRDCSDKWKSKNLIGEKHNRFIGTITIKCANCGEKFERRKNGTQRFCNRKCFHEWFKKNIIAEKHPAWKGGKSKVNCSWCNKIILIYLSRLEKGEPYFCSMKCHGEWDSKYKVGKNHPNYKEKIKIKCDNCGKIKLILQSELNTYDHHFCGTKCFHEWWRKTKVGENCPTYKNGKKQLKCIWCKRIFERYEKNKYKKSGFCSRECYGNWVSKFLIGKKSFAYIHGQSKKLYFKEFLNVRDDIRKRDNYKCQYCGLTQKSNLRKWKNKLCVHHTRYNKFDFNPKYLISLCNKCHIRTNGNRDYWYAYFCYLLNELYGYEYKNLGIINGQDK